MGASVMYHDVGFTYASSGRSVVRHADIWIPEGGFCLLVGPTGSGKSTLLGMLDPKTVVAGTRTGSVQVGGADVSDLDDRRLLESVSCMPQSVGDLLVAETVEAQVAFPLESLGMDAEEMRMRVAEICGFLGVASLAGRRCDDLSSGQRALVALATAVAPFPDVVVCDEPTSALDPEATRAVAEALGRLNRELGTTVVVATHNPRAFKDVADRCYLCEEGSVRPAPSSLVMQPIAYDRPDFPECPEPIDAAIRLDNAWLRYGKREDFVLKGVDASYGSGRIHALVGAHGCGKTTMLETCAGMHRLFKGRIANPFAKNQVYLPQDPTLLFKKETVRQELGALADEPVVSELLGRLGCADVLDAHVDELSGGQASLVAFALCVLSDADLYLLDEPTASLDHAHAQRVADELCRLRSRGKTVLLVAHDMDLVRAVCDDVSLVFAGRIAATLPAARFFSATKLFV